MVPLNSRIALWQSAAKQRRRRRKAESDGKFATTAKIPAFERGFLLCADDTKAGRHWLRQERLRGIVKGMNTVIKGVNLSLTPSLRRYVEEKLVRSVTRIFGRDPGWAATTLELELICETHHHKKGMIWKAVANLKLPGKTFRHAVEAEDIHAAVDGLEDVLKRELTKYKERSRSRLLRGARQVKKSIHFDRSARTFRRGRIRDEGV